MTHDFYRDAEDVITLSQWWMATNIWAKRQAMKHGGLQSVSHDAWLALVSGKPVDGAVQFSTAVCNQTRWTLLEYDSRRRISTDSEATFPDRAELLSGMDSRELQEWRDRITTWVRYLTYRQREVIRRRFGLCDGVSYSLVDTARVFKVTRERIRQIEKQAMKKLRMQAEPYSLDWNPS